MAETPEERLARLRREVEASWTPPRAPDPAGAARPPTAAEPVEGDAAEPPAAAAADVEPTTDADPDSAPAAAASRSPARAAPSPALTPPPVPTRPDPAPLADAPLPATSPGAAGGSGPQPWVPPQRPAAPSEPFRPKPRAPAATADDGWSLADALGGAGLGQWVGVGLVVVGGYLLLAMIVPSIALPGSFLMAAVGVVLLWLHLERRSGAWTLYAGATLAAIGGLRALADLLRLEIRGETALGLGVALLAIAWLRHGQAGGWGWQGILGAVALGWGALQLGLGLLPGSPGVLDLVLPALILGAGVLVLLRALRPRRA